MRFREFRLRHSRWQEVGAFLRHPLTGRAISLRRIQAALGTNMFKDRSWDPQRPKELGAFLRQARLSRGRSLEYMHTHTRVKMAYLEAIESGDFEALPGGLFNRSFVDIYARELGVPGEALGEFYTTASVIVKLPARLEKSDIVETAAEGQQKPPRLAEYLLYLFLTKGERVHLIGDMAEEYVDVYDEFGRRRAKIWYYKQVFDSLRPLVKRTLTKTGIALWLWKNAGWFYDHVQHLINYLKMK